MMVKENQSTRKSQHFIKTAKEPRSYFLVAASVQTRYNYQISANFPKTSQIWLESSQGAALSAMHPCAERTFHTHFRFVLTETRRCATLPGTAARSGGSRVGGHFFWGDSVLFRLWSCLLRFVESQVLFV